ncbi:MAG: site-2 protease family protein [archaeon]
MSFLQFLINYKWPLLFYALIVLLIYLNRKKFTFESKIIAIYKTKLGMNIIDRLATAYPRTIRFLGYIGVIIGFAGMLGSAIYIGYQFIVMVTIPGAPPAVSPVIPGLPIPGTGIVIPFLQGILALFIAVVVHELSHGFVARAHGLKIKSTGFVMFGPLPGAFVEPDEKSLKKKNLHVRNSVFAAGPLANVIAAGVAVLLLSFILAPVINGMAVDKGMTFAQVTSDSPAERAGLQTNITYTMLNDQPLHSVNDFIDVLEKLHVNDTIVLGNENYSQAVVLGSSPTNSEKTYVGVTGLQTVTELKPGVSSFLYGVILWIFILLTWVFILNVGLGMVNLLPIGPLDGGRMFEATLVKFFNEKIAHRVWATVSIIGVVILFLLLVFPLVRGL